MAQKYLLPWNWFRGAFVVNNMVEKFEGAFEVWRARLRGMRGLVKAGTAVSTWGVTPQRSFGPFVIDAAIRTHVPGFVGAERAAPAGFAWPAPEFAPGAMVEEELRRRLAGSSRRKLTGRG